MRIEDKIKEIEGFLEELYEKVPDDVETYKKEHWARAACERYFEKIIEAVVDLAFLIIKENRLKKPEDDAESFEILKQEKIISDELCKKLRNAKSMRNVIAHEYGKIDDELVFEALTEELEKDVKEFINSIEKAKKER